MKLLLLLLVLLSSHNDVPEIQDIRASFKQSNDSEEKAEAFYVITKKAVVSNKAIHKAYYGSALVLKASHCSIFSKLSYFKKGKRLIEEAIQQEPDNIEIRMIRLCIQTNAPKILGYHKQVEEDKAYILENVSKITSETQKEFIEGFIRDSGIFE